MTYTIDYTVLVTFITNFRLYLHVDMYDNLTVANITHYWLPLLLTNYYQYSTLIILHLHYTLLVPYYVYLYSALPVLQISGSVTCFTATPPSPHSADPPPTQPPRSSTTRSTDRRSTSGACKVITQLLDPGSPRPTPAPPKQKSSKNIYHNPRHLFSIFLLLFIDLSFFFPEV